MAAKIFSYHASECNNLDELPFPNELSCQNLTASIVKLIESCLFSSHNNFIFDQKDEHMTYQVLIGTRPHLHLEDPILMISRFKMIWARKIWSISFKRSLTCVSFPYMIFIILVKNDQLLMVILITSCGATAIENHFFHLIFDRFSVKHHNL